MKTFDRSFNTLRLIHNALLLGLFVFLMVALFMVLKTDFPKVTANNDRLLQVIAVVLSIGAVFFWAFGYSKIKFWR